MSPYNPLSPILLPWRYRELVVPLARRKIASRYRGSTLGFMWAILNPLLMLGIYTFVFAVVFHAKWGLESGGGYSFALFLFSGFILYWVFSDAVSEAPSLLLQNKLYIRQLVFPTELLAWISLISGLFHFGINTVILTIFYAWVVGPPSPSALLLPLSVTPIILISLGAVWIISSLGIYLKDLGHLMGLLTTALLFLSPIFYPASAVPESLQPFYALNPFVSILENSRFLLFEHAIPPWKAWLGPFIGSWIFAWFGYFFFMKTKEGFADVV
ncbi:ABC transporter permease [Myxococcota bacterium]|nr:ABC transporter permease [Myxococcota bacterium]